jgi:hypothetical protein
MNEQLENGQNLTLRASGEFLGYTWEFRGDVIGDSAHDWISFMGQNYTEGGSVGPLPFADIGWKKLGHIGSYGWSSGGWSSGGWSRKWLRQIHLPSSINGVVSRKVAKVFVFFKNKTSEEALIIESGHPEAQFFFLPYLPKIQWTEIVALDAEGCKLDRALPWKLPQ